MESYEEFCLKSLARVHAESGCNAPHGHTEARSSIRFHGRHALLPKLSEQQRVQMAEQRQTAIQRECERNTRRLRSLFDRVQDVIIHVQLQKVQGDEQDVNQTVEAPWSKRTPLEEQQYTRLFLNRETEKMRKRGEEKVEEEIQPSCIGEVQVGNKDLGYAEMQSGKKKEQEELDSDRESESWRTLEHLLEVECSNSSDVESMSPDSSIMGSYARLPSPPKPRSNQKLVSVSVNKSKVRLHRFNETFKNSKRREIISTNQSGLSASPGVDWNCSFSDLTKTSCHLITSSTPRSLTSRSPITKFNATQREILNKNKSQGNHCAIRQRFPPASLNRSYDVESPSLIPIRPEIRSGSGVSETYVRHNLEPETRPNHRMNQEEVAATNILQDKTVGDIQRLETSCEQMKEHHALQLSDTQEQETLQQEQQKAARRLTAAAKGFLTRRLLQTGKIKHLIKTIQDSRDVIHVFQADTNQRRASFTIHDLKLQQRVRAQLHAAVCELHEIFFVWPVRDRLALLQQARKPHSERRVKKEEKAKSEQNTPRQSFFTQNSLCHTRQRVLQPAQSQNTPIFSQTLNPARLMRRTKDFWAKCQ